MGVDSALLAMRNYCERAAKELHAAGGRILPKDGRTPPSLQQQLEGLQAWHAFLTTRLQVFKVRWSCGGLWWALVLSSPCLAGTTINIDSVASGNQMQHLHGECYVPNDMVIEATM